METHTAGDIQALDQFLHWETGKDWGNRAGRNEKQLNYFCSLIGKCSHWRSKLLGPLGWGERQR